MKADSWKLMFPSEKAGRSVAQDFRQTSPVRGENNMEDFILFYPETTRFPDLQLRHIGYENCVPGHSYGPAVRSVYLMHIILRGKGTFMANQQSWHLGEGDGFLILPEMQTFYKADERDPWTYFWVAFLGTGAEDVIHDLGLARDSLVFHSSRPSVLLDVVGEMFENRDMTRAKQYMNRSLLYRFFSMLLDDVEVKIGSHTQRNRIVSEAVRYIENSYGDPSIRVTEIAKTVNVERGYLYTLFMKNLGLSPQEYLLKFRLTKATDLLNHTELSIDKIALECGYQDPATFSKAFRKMFGIPPGRFRKRIREQMKTIPDRYETAERNEKGTEPRRT